MASEGNLGAAPVAGEHPLLRAGYKSWLIFVLLVVMIFNFADRALLIVLAQPIKEDLHLTDTDLGLLQGLGFSILYAVVGVPLGMLAERANRTRLIAASVAVWSAMTVACGFAFNFFTLLLGRVGVGIGEAGVMPATMSLISDHFKPSRRASMIAIVTLGGPFGFLLGQAVGGWVASQWDWRMAFYVMGVPGLFVSLLVFFALKEPPRGLADGTHLQPSGAAPSLMETLRYLFAKPAFRHLLAGSTIVNFGLNAIASFVLAFYLRGSDLPLATFGLIFGLVTFTSNGIGMLVGGFGFDALSKRDLRWSLWGPAIAMVLCIPIYFGAFISTAIFVSLTFLWLGNLTMIMFMAPSLAAMQNMARPRMRATTSAFNFVIVQLLGAGLGPTILGMLSDRFAGHAFSGGDFIASCPGGRGGDGLGTALDAACRAASTDGLRYALISVLLLFLWGAVHYVLAARHLRADLYDADREAARAVA